MITSRTEGAEGTEFIEATEKRGRTEIYYGLPVRLRYFVPLVNSVPSVPSATCAT